MTQVHCHGRVSNRDFPASARDTELVGVFKSGSVIPLHNSLPSSPCQRNSSPPTIWTTSQGMIALHQNAKKILVLLSRCKHCASIVDSLAFLLFIVFKSSGFDRKTLLKFLPQRLALQTVSRRKLLNHSHLDLCQKIPAGNRRVKQWSDDYRLLADNSCHDKGSSAALRVLVKPARLAWTEWQ